ncbi:MAG: pentapeptide repeat-containing protein [Pseudomonadota bacterium]
MPTNLIILFALLATVAVITGLGILLGRWPKRAAQPEPAATPRITLASSKHELGLGTWPNPMFGLVGGIWLLIVISLTVGLLNTIWSIPGIAVEAGAGGTPERTLFRLTLITLATLTATLGAAVAVPLTLYRAELTRRQTDTAERAHFNEKINAATDGLHAMRQITKDRANIWEADITRRNAAIDALSGLARERPSEAGRIARMLSVYVRELSREVPPKTPPEDADPKALFDWAQGLKVERSDMESAVKALGEMQPDLTLSPGDIDLSGANLQAMTLSNLNFEQALLRGAQMQRANLFRAGMQKADVREAGMQTAVLFQAEMQGADLRDAEMQGADLRDAEMQGAVLFQAEMQGATLVGARMQGATLAGAEMQGATLVGAQMQGANLGNARMQGANLGHARMQGADLLGAEMQGADLAWARMSEDTDLSAATLRGAALRSVDDITLAQVQPYLQDMFTEGEGLVGDDYLRAWRAFQDGLEDFPKEWKVQIDP